MLAVDPFLEAERLRIREAVQSALAAFNERGPGMAQSTTARSAAWTAGRDELDAAIHRILYRVSSARLSAKQWEQTGKALGAFVDEQLSRGIRSYLTPSHRQEEFNVELVATWAEELKADVRLAVSGEKKAIQAVWSERCWAAGLTLLGLLVGWFLGRL